MTNTHDYIETQLAYIGAELTKEMLLVGIENPNWASLDHQLQLTMKADFDRLSEISRLLTLAGEIISQMEDDE